MLMAKKNISVSVKIKDLERMKINTSISEEKNLTLSIYFESKINLRVSNSLLLKSGKSLVNFIGKNFMHLQQSLNFYTET